MKQMLSIIGTIAGLAIAAPFLIPPLLGLFVAHRQNMRDAQRRNWHRTVRIHHGGKCTCEFCNETRNLRKAAQ